jgi:hypothetical protein
MKLNKILLTSLLALGGLVGCGEKPAEQKKLYFGVGYEAEYEKVDHSSGKVANNFSVTVVAAAFDEDGKVVVAQADEVQVKVRVTEVAGEEGVTYTYGTLQQTGQEEGVIKTKQELGTNYGMYPKAWGSQLAEVDSQMNAFTTWTKGKTVAEVEAYEGEIEGCTIQVTSMTKALKKAGERKAQVAAYTDVNALKVGVGMVSSMGLSYGSPEASVTFNGALVEAGKAVANFVDAAVLDFQGATAESEKDADGAILLDYKENKYVQEGVITSKYDLGDLYAMKGSSALGKEWNEQADAFNAAVVGKTAAEVEAMTEIEGVSITANALVGAAKKAIEYSGLEHIGPQYEGQPN